MQSEVKKYTGRARVFTCPKGVCGEGREERKARRWWKQEVERGVVREGWTEKKGNEGRKGVSGRERPIICLTEFIV